jgi:hypothetical protein
VDEGPRICKREGCGRVVAPSLIRAGHTYCCRDCAPYGNLVGGKQSGTKARSGAQRASSVGEVGTGKDHDASTLIQLRERKHAPVVVGTMQRTEPRPPSAIASGSIANHPRNESGYMPSNTARALPAEEERNSMPRKENTMPDTPSGSGPRSLVTRPESIPRSISSGQPSNTLLDTLDPMSLLDDSSTHLHSLMTSLIDSARRDAKSVDGFMRVDYQRVNAICGVAKNFHRVMSLKLQILKTVVPK